MEPDTMNRSIIFVAAASLQIGTGLASERLPSFPKNTDYDQARNSLLALGYKPADVSKDPNRCLPQERCVRYPEAEHCYGTGMARCQFLWVSPRGGVIEIGTIGEDDPPGVEKVTCRANC